MFLCWNHLFQDCKCWLRLHGVSKSDEMSYYVDSVRSLLESSSLADFHIKLITAMKKWIKPFTNYFIDNIHNSIDRLGVWELRPYCLSTSTTNQLESFNFVLMKLQDWKEVPMDCMALAMFRLQQFYLREIQRGHYGQGNYDLRHGLSQTTFLPNLPDQTPPEEIVDSIRNAMLAD